jgi:hypothetical protein
VSENRTFPKESVVVLNTVFSTAALARDYLNCLPAVTGRDTH